jgi:hypothetical protein
MIVASQALGASHVQELLERAKILEQGAGGGKTNQKKNAACTN